MKPFSTCNFGYIHQTISYYLVLTYAFDLLSCALADPASDHIEIAKKLLSAGKYGDALPHLHEAINHNPKDYLTYFKRATVYLAINRPRSALDDLSKAIELKNDFTSALKQRADVYIRLGELDLAHMDFERLLTMGYTNQDIEQMFELIEKLRQQIKSAQDLIAENQHDIAINIITSIIDEVPYNTHLLQMRANAFVVVGELRRAISDYKAIAKLNVDASTYLKIAKLCYKLGEIEESMKNIRDCLKLDPDHKSCMEFYKPTKKLNNHIHNMVGYKDSNDHDDCYNSGKNALKLLKKGQDPLALIHSIQSVMCHCLSKAAEVSNGLKVCQDALDNSDEGGIEGIAIDKPDIICDKADLLAENEDYTEAAKLYQESQKIRQSKRAREGIERVNRLQKQKKKRDYYKILGVSRNADEIEINKAYRKLAAKWHPDRHKDPDSKEQAQKKFMDIADAKAVLTDPEKRQIYDRGEDPLDPESKQHNHAHHGFHGDPFGHFGGGGAPFTFKFNFG